MKDTCLKSCSIETIAASVVQRLLGGIKSSYSCKKWGSFWAQRLFSRFAESQLLLSAQLPWLGGAVAALPSPQKKKITVVIVSHSCGIFSHSLLTSSFKDKVWSDLVFCSVGWFTQFQSVVVQALCHNCITACACNKCALNKKITNLGHRIYSLWS